MTSTNANKQAVLNATDNGTPVDQLTARFARLDAYPVKNPLRPTRSAKLLALLAPEFPADHEAVTWQYGDTWSMRQAEAIEDMLKQLASSACTGTTKRRLATSIQVSVRHAIKIARQAFDLDESA